MTIQQKEKTGEYLAVFMEVTRLISNVHDPQQVMDLVVHRLPELLAIDAATIRLLDSGTNSFVLGAAHGVSAEYLSRSSIDSDDVITSLLKGEPVVRTDLDRTCDHESCTLVSREGVESVLSLPIIYKQQILGLLRLLTREKRVFSEGEIAFSMSLAEQVGLAISSSQLFQEMENQIRFYEEQLEISRLVHSTLDLDTILDAIVEKLPALFKVKGCTIRLLHPATNRLELVASSGLSNEYLNRGSIRREDSVFKVLKGEPVTIYDAPNDTRVEYHSAITAEGIKSILAVPIRNNTEIIGVLRLLSTTHRTFTQVESCFAKMIAEVGGAAIEKARTYRKITLLFNQIEEHERLLQTIVDGMEMQLIVVDVRKRIILANKQVLLDRNLLEAEMVGRPYSELFQDCNSKTGVCPLEWVLQNQERLTVTRESLLGEERNYLEHHFTPIVDGVGKVQFVMELIRDISDQVRLEKEKLARVKLEGVIEMAGTAAHELNTPLFAALGTAELLRDDINSPELQEEFDMIIRNLRKIKDQTRKMATVTGFESQEYVGDSRIVRLKNEEKQ